MAVLEFPGPGLTIEQWNQLGALATSVKPGQALWISGYFAGIEHSARAFSGEALTPATADFLPPQPAAAAPLRTLTILYGSETGNSSALAKALAEAARAQGLQPTVVDMADYKPRVLKEEQDFIIVTSTHGEGEPPLSGMSFFEFIEGRKAPRLPQVRFAVLALGDSTYEHYCGAGKRLDQRLEELGAVRLADRVDCDVDYDKAAAGWTETVLAALKPASDAGPTTESRNGLPAAAIAAAPSASTYDKRNPYPARIIDNFLLTGRGSTKETRHIELSLDDSGLIFEPGDALGVMPRNDPALAETLLQALGLSADAPVTVKDRTTTLGEALVEALEITAATPRFLEHWTGLSAAADLEALAGDDRKAERTAFLRGHHVTDIVRRFPVKGIDAQTFVAGLRPLQPRLYSIASSLAIAPDEAHLTVSTVRYELHGEGRAGVASGHFAERAEPDTIVPVYIQANPHFRLPADDASILMIGAGTGIAPYRAFLQEREAKAASGRSWLFFGERNFSSDFLYQTEWQAYLKEGVLSRMNVAFSRDGSAKTYVQHRLIEHGRDVYAWLEEGAHLYLCGDATHLAPDVHAALLKIVQQHRGCGEEAAVAYLDALRRDHRYLTDVY
ncbi:assimilatory sulfite reductase (NADPH) flavoprotein subunit [Pseudaminobacter sp. NGMCC 1.201702]|uniref:assimilatory sulfite reductase (NADPH) flavoprotein subunit n=1 Tax=Pseudaminobacter sp. NGMCC 1.201702 TaxID=3391825 RepID=UPI0039EFA5D9